MPSERSVALKHLIDANKKGTIILGSYRCGSHFIGQLAVEESQKLAIDYVYLDEHIDEHADFPAEFSAMDQRNQYVISIMNHPPLIRWLHDNVRVLEDYFVIRLKCRDLSRWYISWFALHYPVSDLHKQFNRRALNYADARIDGQPVKYFGSNDCGFYFDSLTSLYISSWCKDKGLFRQNDMKDFPFDGHNVFWAWHRVFGDHDQSYQLQFRDWQESLLKGYEPIRLTKQDGKRLEIALRGMQALHDIPVDAEFYYEDMSAMATRLTPWMPKNYFVAGIPLSRLLTQGDWLTSQFDACAPVGNGKFKGV